MPQACSLLSALAHPTSLPHPGEELLPEEDPLLFKPVPEPNLLDSYLVGRGRGQRRGASSGSAAGFFKGVECCTCSGNEGLGSTALAGPEEFCVLTLQN